MTTVVVVISISTISPEKPFELCKEEIKSVSNNMYKIQNSEWKMPSSQGKFCMKKKQQVWWDTAASAFYSDQQPANKHFSSNQSSTQNPAMPYCWVLFTAVGLKNRVVRIK